MDLPIFGQPRQEPPTEPNFGVPRARRVAYRGAMRDATALEAVVSLGVEPRVRLRRDPEHEEATRRWLAELVADSSRWEAEPPESGTPSGWMAAAAA